MPPPAPPPSPPPAGVCPVPGSGQRACPASVPQPQTCIATTPVCSGNLALVFASNCFGRKLAFAAVEYTDHRGQRVCSKKLCVSLFFKDLPRCAYLYCVTPSSQHHAQLKECLHQFCSTASSRKLI